VEVAPGVGRSPTLHNVSLGRAPPGRRGTRWQTELSGDFLPGRRGGRRGTPALGWDCGLASGGSPAASGSQTPVWERPLAKLRFGPGRARARNGVSQTAGSQTGVWEPGRTRDVLSPALVSWRGP